MAVPRRLLVGASARFARYGRFAWCALLVPPAIVVACGDPSHVFSGRLFVHDRSCLGTTSSLDVVEGDPASRACPATCLAQPLRDGGRSLYVSTTCPPYPFPWDASGADPMCAPALAALARGDTCFTDGGSQNPLPPILDAGGDTD